MRSNVGSSTGVRPGPQRSTAATPAMSPSISAAASSPNRVQRAGPRRDAIARALPEVAVAVAPRAKARSAADWKRRAGSFSRHRWTTRPTHAGVESGRGAGSDSRIARPLSAKVAPGNARAPVSSS